jgi:mannose-6-phosphate isomerase-like protein (cupin superfamily)
MGVQTQEDHRPWGYYRVLEEGGGHKIKRIVVYPGQRLSLQRHRLRDEHWFIIQGTAVITRGGDDLAIGEGQSLEIPRGTLHRVFNPGQENLVFVEVQTGAYFGEDDVERIADDYGRVGDDLASPNGAKKT